MPQPGRAGAPMHWLLSSALLLAIGMIAAGVVAGRTLRQRDAAVREGIVLRAAHDLERDLRERGPESVQATLASFVAAARVSAVELVANGRILQRAGMAQGHPIEVPVFLGPAWRDLAGGPPLRMARGHPPFQLRLWPSRGVGDSRGVAALATWGSVTAALALLLFAALAARNVEAAQRATALEAERHRLEIVSAAGAGLAHRIRNPLATIKATAQVLESRVAPDEHERAHRIVDASVRIEALVQELLAFARPVEVHAERMDLTSFASHRSDPVMVSADREHVTSAVEELIANAQQAGDANPEIVVARDGRHVRLAVRDRGAGLQLDADRAFDPYVTTRADGTGLGLPTVRALIRANGGDITLAAREGGGCIATITLPAVSA